MNFRFLFLIVFLLPAQIKVFSQQYIIDQIIGVVGSKPIKLSDVETGFMQQKAQGNYGTGDLKCEVFENLLGQKLMINQAMLDSVKVSDAQVEAELSRSVSGAVAQLGSVDKVEQHYGKSLAEIKEDLRDSYRDLQMARMLQSEIIEDVKITPSEIEEYYSKMAQDSLPMINTQIELAQIALYPAYSEEAILAAKDKLLELLKTNFSGGKFNALARLYSEDEGSASRGGEIGFQSKADLDPEYAKAAFALKKSGEVSRIVESKFGYHLIQLVERKGDKVNTCHILVKPKPDPAVVKRTRETLDSIALFIRRDSVKFDKAVAFYSQDVETRNNNGMVSSAGGYGGTKLDLEQQVAPVDYNVIKKMKVGEISNVYESRDKNGKIYYKIICLKSITPTHRANLKDDYYLVQEITKTQKKAKILEKWYSDKQKMTFIRIDDSFKNCQYRSAGWLKDGI